MNSPAANNLKSCPLAGVILAPVNHGLLSGGGMNVQPIIPPCLQDACAWWNVEEKECMCIVAMKKFIQDKTK